MILNQVLFVSGVTLTIGLKSSMQFFMKRSNFKFFLLSLSLPLFRAYTNVTFLFTTLSLSVVGQGTISFGLGFVACVGNDFGGIWVCHSFQV